MATHEDDEGCSGDAQQRYQECWDELERYTPRLVRRLFDSWKWLLTFSEVLGACETAISEAAWKYKPERGDLTPFYVTIAKNHVIDRARKHGFGPCDLCRASGNVDWQDCPECRRLWKFLLRPSDIDDWGQISEEYDDGSGFDPLRPFEWSPETWEKLEDWQRKLIREIERQLTSDERVVWWAHICSGRHSLTGADLAEKLDKSEENIRQIRKRAKAKGERILQAFGITVE